MILHIHSTKFSTGFHLVQMSDAFMCMHKILMLLNDNQLPSWTYMHWDNPKSDVLSALTPLILLAIRLIRNPSENISRMQQKKHVITKSFLVSYSYNMTLPSLLPDLHLIIKTTNMDNREARNQKYRYNCSKKLYKPIVTSTLW